MYNMYKYLQIKKKKITTQAERKRRQYSAEHLSSQNWTYDDTYFTVAKLAMEFS